MCQQLSFLMDTTTEQYVLITEITPPEITRENTLTCAFKGNKDSPYSHTTFLISSTTTILGENFTH